MDADANVLSVEVAERDDRLLVTLAGELDEDTAAAVRDLDLTGARPGCQGLDLDLGALHFLDSSGIGALVSLRNHATSLELTTAVIAAPASIRHTFAVAGLAGLFGVQP